MREDPRVYGSVRLWLLVLQSGDRIDPRSAPRGHERGAEGDYGEDGCGRGVRPPVVRLHLEEQALEVDRQGPGSGQSGGDSESDHDAGLSQDEGVDRGRPRAERDAY